MLSPSSTRRAGFRVVSLSFVGLIFSLTSIAAAQEAAAEGQALNAPAPTAGLRIYVDPETGELTSRPTREQARRLSAAIGAFLTRPIDEPVVFQLPFGGTGVYVGNRFESVSVVRVRPDGSFDFECVHPEHTTEILAAPAAPPTDSMAYAPR